MLDRLELKEKKEEVEDKIDEIINVNDLFLENDDKKDLEVPVEEKNNKKELEVPVEEKDDKKKLEVHTQEKDEREDICDSNLVQDDNQVEVKDTNQVEVKDTNQVEVKDTNQQSAMKKETIEKSLFSNIDDSIETYATYLVYIVRDNDSIDDILTKYNTTRDKLNEYNDLSDFKKGMKLIIPTLNE